MSHTIPTFIKEEAAQTPGHRVVSAWCNGAVVYSTSCTLLELDYHLANAASTCEAAIRRAQAPVGKSQSQEPLEPAGFRH